MWHMLWPCSLHFQKYFKIDWDFFLNKGNKILINTKGPNNFYDFFLF
jgi:hypothetical protein